MGQKTKRGSGELQESVGHGSIIGNPSPPSALERASLSSLQVVVSPRRPVASSLSDSQRMDEADKIFALRVAKRITFVGCASFYYDALMDVIVAVSAARSEKWAFFAFTLVASYLPGVALALHALYWGPFFEKQGYGKPRIVAIMQLTLTSCGVGSYNLWKYGTLPHTLLDFVSGMLRKTLSAYPNGGILTYQLLTLDPEKEQSLRVFVLSSLSSVLLLTMSLHYKNHFVYGPPFFLEKYRLLKCLSLWWVVFTLAVYDFCLVIHRLLFYGLLAYVHGFGVSVAVGALVILVMPPSLFPSIRAISGIGWDAKTGDRSIAKHWHSIFSVLTLQSACMIHNDCFFDRAPIWTTYARYVDLPLHISINAGFIITFAIRVSSEPEKWDTLSDPINAFLLWSYVAGFFGWMLMRIALMYMLSAERSVQREALDAFSTMMREKRMTALQEFQKASIAIDGEHEQADI